MEHGQKVKILSGPFKGMIGHVDGHLVMTGLYMIELSDGRQLGFHAEELEIID